MQKDDELAYQQFKLVFIQYYSALCNYAYTFTKDFHDSEDIVQELFLRIWDKKQDLISSESIRYYLFTSVRNNSLSFIQNKKKLLGTDAFELHAKAMEVMPAEASEARPSNELSMINQGVALLPPRCKEVFLLSRIGNLPYKEIAKSLNISVKTVENQISKAIRILRNFIKNQPFTVIMLAMHFIYQ